MPLIKDARVKIVVSNTMNTCTHCGLHRAMCRAALNIPSFRDKRTTPAIDDAVFTRYQGETFGWKAGLPNAT